MNSKISSLIATMIVVILMLLQMCPVISFAIDEVNLNNEVDKTNIANVKFDVYFSDERRDVEYNLSKEEGEIILYTKLTVKEAGYLDNIVVDFSNCNFNVELAEENEMIQSLEKNKLKLNKVSKDETKVIALKVSRKEFEKMPLDELYRSSLVKLSGKYTNAEGKEEALTSEKEIKVSYTGDVESELSVEISKYIPVLTVAGNKLMLQEKINSKIVDDKLPIGKTKIELEIPELEGKLPEEIRVVGESGATKGNALGKEFGIENYSYDIEKKIVTIEVENKEEIIDEKDNTKKEEYANWSKGEVDEYLVTFIYDQEVLEKALETEEKVNIKANGKIEILDEKKTIVEKELNGEVALSGEIGSIVSGKVEAKNEINKGYMLTNTKALEENRKETEYKTEYEVEIGYSDVVDRVSISLEEDGYVRGNKEEVVEGSTYIKEISLNKEEVKKLLGEEGNIKLVSNDVEVYEINKDLWNNKQETISLDVSKLDLSKLTLVTSNVKEEGKLRIDTLKAIKADNYYSAEEIEEISKIRSREIVEAYNEENKISEKEEMLETEVKGTELKASLRIDREKLTTVKTNEKVKMTTVLETNSIDDKLFENPSIEISMPKSFERVENIEANIYFDDELVITNGQLVENEDGSKVVKVDLEGIQTKYNLVSNGTVIDIISDITLNKLTPSEEEEIGFKVLNVSEEISNTYKILTDAPEELIMTSEVKNENGEVILSSENGINTTNLRVGQQTKKYTFELNVLNNTDDQYNDVFLLGRLPVKENNNLKTGEAFNSNFNISTDNYRAVAKYIRRAYKDSEGNDVPEVEYDGEEIEVKFSRSNTIGGLFETDINDWVVGGPQESKSFLVPLDLSKFTRGSYINVKFDMYIPSFMEFEYQTYMQYKLVGTKNNEKMEFVSEPIEFKTGIGPKIEVELKSDRENEKLLISGETFDARMIIKNVGSIDINDGIINLVIPEYLELIRENNFSLLGYSIDTEFSVKNRIIQVGENGEEGTETVITKEYNMGELKAGDTKEMIVTLRAKSINSDTENLQDDKGALYYIFEGGELVLNSNSYIYNVANSYYDFSTTFSTDRDKMIVGTKEEITFSVKNVVPTDIRNNTSLSMNWPEGINIIRMYNSDTGEEIEYSLNNGKLMIKAGELNAFGVDIKIEISGNDYEGNDSKIINFGKVTITSDGDEKGSEYEVGQIKLNKIKINVEQTCTVPSNTIINASEDFIYTYTIKNESIVPISEILLEDFLPKELIFIESEIVNKDGTTRKTTSYNEDGNPTLNLSAGAGETVIVKIHVRAGNVEKDTIINNYAIIKSDSFAEFKTNEIKHTVKRTEGYVNGDSQNTTVADDDGDETRIDDNASNASSIKRISGTIWIDINNNGEREASETKQGGVSVILLDANSGKIVVDSEGNKCVTNTDSNGDYSFTKLTSGKYMVAFLYDSSKYTATIYKKEGVNEALNSDAIDTKAIVKSENRIIALTENLTLANENIYNIDLGLVTSENFDLRIDKTIEEVSVTIGKETTTYKYGTNFAKVDIPAKNQNEATLVVKYKIKITNEGMVSGQINQIVDYIPSELEYSDTYNKGWYQGNNREAINETLKGKELRPGEISELTLILTKKMNANGFGLVSNNAEISKYSNEMGKNDIDSLPGNKNTEEDDYSTANLLILVKTGHKQIYIITAIVSSILIIVSIYFIKKQDRRYKYEK